MDETEIKGGCKRLLAFSPLRLPTFVCVCLHVLAFAYAPLYVFLCFESFDQAVIQQGCPLGKVHRRTSKNSCAFLEVHFCLVLPCFVGRRLARDLIWWAMLGFKMSKSRGREGAKKGRKKKEEGTWKHEKNPPKPNLTIKLGNF